MGAVWSSVYSHLTTHNTQARKTQQFTGSSHTRCISSSVRAMTVDWTFDVSIWKHLPIQLSNGVLKMVLNHVPDDPNCILVTPAEQPRELLANSSSPQLVSFFHVQAFE